MVIIKRVDCICLFTLVAYIANNMGPNQIASRLKLVYSALGSGLENSTSGLIFTSASGCRTSKNFDKLTYKYSNSGQMYEGLDGV